MPRTCLLDRTGWFRPGVVHGRRWKLRPRLTEGQAARAGANPYRRHVKLNIQLVAWVLAEHCSRGRTVSQIRQDLHERHGVQVSARTIANVIRGRAWKTVYPHALRIYPTRTKLTADEVMKARYLHSLGIPAATILDELGLPVSHAGLGRALRFETWRYLPEVDKDALSRLLFGGALEPVVVPGRKERSRGGAKRQAGDSGSSMVAKNEEGFVYVVGEAPSSRGLLGHRRGRALVRQYDERGRLRAISNVRGDGFHRTLIRERQLRRDAGLGLLVEKYAEPSRDMLLETERGGLTPVKPPSDPGWRRAPRHPADWLIGLYVTAAKLGPRWDGPVVLQHANRPASSRDPGTREVVPPGTRAHRDG